MAKYRDALPQLSGDWFLTEGGIETTLVFHKGVELPEFASFPLLDDQASREMLRDCIRPYFELARKHSVGMINETLTWRASRDWAQKLGISSAKLERLIRAAVDEVVTFRKEYESNGNPVVISGCIGPRGDAYNPDRMLGIEEAERYHAEQIGVFRDTEVDLVTAATLTHVEEAIGITRAAGAAGLPVVISFTVETDGRLPNGIPLGEAIDAVDQDDCTSPAYYMINCAHPTHFSSVLEPGAGWAERIRCLRTNSSALSHAELDESTEIDEGDPAELGRQHRKMLETLTNVNILGGCCGTDERHIDAIFQACKAN
ncbi:MAG: homocysteine S-methyltransferase [Gammaproteobacteria bacterium]|nr:MAG: homocysteine S-methyltransferase [Gammaproteobacteria bacterium]